MCVCVFACVAYLAESVVRLSAFGDVRRLPDQSAYQGSVRGADLDAALCGPASHTDTTGEGDQINKGEGVIVAVVFDELISLKSAELLSSVQQSVPHTLTCKLHNISNEGAGHFEIDPTLLYSMCTALNNRNTFALQEKLMV